MKLLLGWRDKTGWQRKLAEKFASKVHLYIDYTCTPHYALVRVWFDQVVEVIKDGSVLPGGIVPIPAGAILNRYWPAPNDIDVEARKAVQKGRFA